MPLPLLIAKTGDTLDSVRQAHGDFGAMFAGAVDDVELQVVDAVRDPGALPDPKSVAGVIITGSPHSVTQPEPWTDALAEWSTRAIELGVPTLGVCYGHQLLAYAFGGRVERNTQLFEIGTIEVDLTEAGKKCALLAPLANGFGHLHFQAVHGDIVTELPEGAECLATNGAAKHQAFGLGEHVRAVQFHPEFSADVMGLYIDGRSEVVVAHAAAHGYDPKPVLARARAGLCETPAGPALLRRFVDHYVLRR